MAGAWWSRGILIKDWRVRVNHAGFAAHGKGFEFYSKFKMKWPYVRECLWWCDDVLSCSVMSDSWDPIDVACQAPLSMGFSRQEYWSGLLFPSPGYLPDPGIEPRSRALQADSSLTELQGKPQIISLIKLMKIRTTETFLPIYMKLESICWSSLSGRSGLKIKRNWQLWDIS